MLQGGPQHTGQSDQIGPVTPTESTIFTSAPGPNLSDAPVVIANHTAYLAYSAFGIVHVDAISLSTHKLAWDWSSVGSLLLGGLAVGSDGTVYLSDGSLVAISPAGQLRWTYNTDAQVFGPPTVGPDGTVYVDSLGPSVFALDPVNGDVLWSYDGPPSPVDTPIGSTPAISPDGKTLYDSESGSLVALSAGADGGKLLWSEAAPGGAAFDAAPAVGPDGTVYVVTAGPISCVPLVACNHTAGDLQALRPDGSVKWSYRGSAPLFTTPAVSDTGLVIVTANDGITVALSQITGQTVWKDRVGVPVNGSLYNPPSAAVGLTGNVYVAYDDVLSAITPAGVTLWTLANFPGGEVAIGPDGYLYSASEMAERAETYSTLVCVGPPTDG